MSLVSPALAGGFFPTSATWEAHSLVGYSHLTAEGEVWLREIKFPKDTFMEMKKSGTQIYIDFKV